MEQEAVSVQVQKEITFKELCPEWFAKLTGHTHRVGLSFMNGAMCIVGEAYGFEKGADYYNCHECLRFSGTFGAIAYNRYNSEDRLNSEEIVKGFMNHWNSEHLK